MCRYIVFVALLVVQANTQYLTRVIQGLPASISQFPILAQLHLDAWGNQEFVQHCAGVILTSRHVLSAGHCFQHSANTGRNYTLPKYWKIRVGSSFRSRGGSLHTLKTIIRHPHFHQYFYFNDLAVVVVSKPFVFGPNVKQGTLIKQGVEVKPDSVTTLVGWGAQEPGGPQPDVLQYTTLYTIENDVCVMRYSTIGAIIGDSMLCAGRLDIGGPDGCFGDSGGPLIYKGLVVGIVSFGYSCGHSYYPGVYTKISHHTNWIITTVNNNK